jgi:hypothetical protein
MNNFKFYRRFSVFKFQRSYFCGKEGQNRYNYEYESPEEQNISMITILQKSLKIFLKSCVFFLFCKWIIFTKYNDLTKQYNTYLINEAMEIRLNDYVSRNIQKMFENYIFRTDTPEAELVCKLYTKLLNDNKIKFSKGVNIENIYIIESPSIGAVLLKNGDLFLSNRIIQLAESEDEIAFFIACEMAHLLCDKVSNRFKNVLLDKMLPQEETSEVQSNDFTKIKRDSIEEINKYLLFYPESYFNYFEEIDICRIALKLLKNSGFDLQQVNIFNIVYKNYEKV